MIRFVDILKGLIVYILFVVGLSILSVYLKGRSSFLDDKLDMYLESIKRDIKQNFSRENFGQGNCNAYKPPHLGAPRYPLGFNGTAATKPQTEEEYIIQQVNKRLQNSDMTFDGNSYTNLNQNNYIPLATNGDFSDQPTTFPWGNNQGPVERLPRYNNYPIDNYTYQPNGNF